MRRLAVVASILALGVSAASAQNTLRVWFDTSGWTSALPTPQPAPAVGVPSLGAAGRLYIWASAIDGGNATTWQGISLNIDIDGPGTLSTPVLYAPVDDSQSPGDTTDDFKRWDAAVPGAASAGNTESNNNNMVAVSANTYGVRRQLGINGNTGLRYTDGFVDNIGPPSNVLLGYVDVNPNGGTSDVFLEVGSGGIARRGGNVAADRVIFGGDDTVGILGNAFGSRNGGADARLTPEPASLVLLALGALALRRR